MPLKRHLVTTHCWIVKLTRGLYPLDATVWPFASSREPQGYSSNCDSAHPVADRGCMVLYNLSLDERNHSYLNNLGVLDLMQKAIQLHPGDKVLESILQSSSGLLRGDV
jgi:hypothetical protein